jgi:hypothetical protein
MQPPIVAIKVIMCGIALFESGSWPGWNGWIITGVKQRRSSSSPWLILHSSRKYSIGPFGLMIAPTPSLGSMITLMVHRECVLFFRSVHLNDQLNNASGASGTSICPITFAHLNCHRGRDYIRYWCSSRRSRGGVLVVIVSPFWSLPHRPVFLSPSVLSLLVVFIMIKYQNQLQNRNKSTILSC